MTARQSILRFLYPVFRKLSNLNNSNSEMLIQHYSNPPVSFHSLKASLSNGAAFDFSLLKGRKVLIVNTASDCGFTKQLEEMELLYDRYQKTLMVLAFPANDFKGQEPGTNEEIENFCKLNYETSFPIFAKARVLKPGQQEVFDWLTSEGKNGWNNNEPSWNFCKYLINEKGKLIATFKSHVSPLHKTVIALINTPAPGGITRL